MKDDMSELMNNLSDMLKNNEIPDEVKNFVNNFNSSSSEEESSRSSSNDDFPDIDINTILKLKKVMDGMKNTKDDPRANLLISLKPYLRESKKAKVDQYVKLFGMSKIIELINPTSDGIGDLFGFKSKCKSNDNLGGDNSKI